VNRIFTLEQLKKTACYSLNKDKLEQLTAVKQPKQQKRSNGSKTKAWIELQLTAWCEANGLTLIPEYRFSEVRRWRSDYYVKELNTLIEYEGLNSAKSRHTTKTGYTNDSDKYSEASKMGFILIRITALNYKSLFKHLEEIKSSTNL
jgi:hypothetical protein